MPRNNRIFSGPFSNTDDQTLGLGSLQIGSPNYYTQVSHTSIEPLALQPSSNAKGKGKKGKKQKPNHTKVFEEWKAYFGAESNLANWQRLCGDLGLDDNLPSITKCKQVPSPRFPHLLPLLPSTTAVPQTESSPSFLDHSKPNT